MENFNREDSSLFSMELDEQGKGTFLEMARWTKFLAIIGFIFLGLCVVGGIFVAMAMSAISAYGGMGVFSGIGAVGIMLIYILIAALNFYPVYALYKYSTGMKVALATSNRQKFNEAVGYLKNMFKYMGIFMIILLGIYGIIILLAIAGAMR